MSINRLENYAQQLKSGFTIVEMLIIAPIVILVIGTFISAIVNMTGEILMTRGANVLAYSVQDALNRIEADVKLSTTFLAKNSVTLTSPQGYDDSSGNSISDFANVGTNGNMLILNTLATSGNPLSASSSLVYLNNVSDPKQPNACNSTQVNQNTPMTMNVIYFVKNGTLWRRTIAPINYLTAGCATPWQQPSCNPGINGAFCKTQDNRLVDNVNPEDFVLQYFNSANATVADSIAADVDQTDAQRNTALQSDTTVVASLNINKMLAGRNINQKGTIRSTRLDINASTIAPVVPDVVPTAPIVTASFVGPDIAKFDWPAVTGAATYTLDYTLDATPGPNIYTNGALNNTTLRTFSITGIQNKKICVRVSAKNSAGTSITNGSACVTIPPWNALILQNTWSNYGDSFATGAYTKTSVGIVVLKGLLQRSSTPAYGEVIAQLPVGYRPTSRLIFQTTTNDSTNSLNIASRIDIDTSGNVIFIVGNSAWMGLNGINFVASTSGYSFTNMSLLNGWTPYGQVYATPAYTKDSVGRVFLQGLAQSGVGVIAALPSGYRPPQAMYIPADSGNTFGDFGFDTSGNIIPHVYSSAFFSIQEMFYPAAYPSGGSCTTSWCNLTLQNGWLNYDPSFTTPQYTKASDGLVTIKGFIKSGVTDYATVIANLPAGYRPKERLLMTAIAVDTPGRVDIMPNGDIIAVATSSVWTSIDAISFMAEQ